MNRLVLFIFFLCAVAMMGAGGWPSRTGPPIYVTNFSSGEAVSPSVGDFMMQGTGLSGAPLLSSDLANLTNGNNPNFAGGVIDTPRIYHKLCCQVRVNLLASDQIDLQIIDHDSSTGTSTYVGDKLSFSIAIGSKRLCTSTVVRSALTGGTFTVGVPSKSGSNDATHFRASCSVYWGE